MLGLYDDKNSKKYLQLKNYLNILKNDIKDILKLV